MEVDSLTAVPVVDHFVNITLSNLPSQFDGIDRLDQPDEKTVEVLWRNQAKELASRMHNAANGGMKCQYVLIGPGGCGKSVTLFSLAHWARSQNWLVLYIAEAASWADKTDATLARNILDLLNSANGDRWPDSYESLSYNQQGSNRDIDHTAMIAKARKAVEDLCTRNTPALLAIDQWNVIRNPTTSDVFKWFFGTFAKCQVRRGATLLAVSSSFYAPVAPPGQPKIFEDNNFIERQHRLRLYSDDEARLIIERYRARSKLPSVGNGLDDERIRKLTGHAGRMIRELCSSWDQSPIVDGKWCEQHEATFRTRTTNYYYRRVESLIMHTSNDDATEEQRRVLLDYLARIFLNKQRPQDLSNASNIPTAFQWAGLYNFDVTPIRPVCPSVIAGINQAVTDIQTHILEIMIENEQTRGTALELFVQRVFREGGNIINPKPGHVTLHTTNLAASDPINYSLVINEVRVQDMRSPGNVLDELTDGTLIICHRNHAVVDMILYYDNCVYFIQISMQSYTNHDKKIDHLLSSRVQGTDISMLKFYTQAAVQLWPSYTVMRHRVTKQVKDGIKYIYITPDVTKHVLNKSGAGLTNADVRRSDLSFGPPAGASLFERALQKNT